MPSANNQGSIFKSITQHMTNFHQKNKKYAAICKKEKFVDYFYICTFTCRTFSAEHVLMYFTAERTRNKKDKFKKSIFNFWMFSALFRCGQIHIHFIKSLFYWYKSRPQNFYIIHAWYFKFDADYVGRYKQNPPERITDRETLKWRVTGCMFI